MIYYHFPNKRALYTCIIRDVFGAHRRARARGRRRRRAAQTPAGARHRRARAIGRRSTHFLPMFLREIADGGAHLGPEELALVPACSQRSAASSPRARSRRCFSPSIRRWRISRSIGPLVMFRATAPVRCADSNAAAGGHSRCRFDTPCAITCKMVAHRMLGRCRCRGTLAMCVWAIADCSRAAVQRVSPGLRRQAGARVSGQVDATEVQVRRKLAARSSSCRSRKAIAWSKAMWSRASTRGTWSWRCSVRRPSARRRRAASSSAGRRAAGRHPAGRSAGGGRGRRSRGGTDRSRRRRDGPPAIRAAVAGESGSQKQRDDAAARRDVARDRLQAVKSREPAAREASRGCGRDRDARKSRRRARRVAAVDAQIATLEKLAADAVVRAPIERRRHRAAAGRSAKWPRPGRRSRSSSNLDHAWAEVFVDEPRSRASGWVRRPPSSPMPAARASRQGQFHRLESRVHAAERADRRRPVEARLPGEDCRRQPAGRAQAGNAGRGGDSRPG